MDEQLTAYASMLIGGDGVDLVTRHNGRFKTVQLSCAEARNLAATLLIEADASERDALKRKEGKK